jgi:hypothetical protein
LLEARGYKVMAFCGLGDYKGTSGKRKVFPKAPPRCIRIQDEDRVHLSERGSPTWQNWSNGKPDDHTAVFRILRKM